VLVGRVGNPPRPVYPKLSGYKPDLLEAGLDNPGKQTVINKHGGDENSNLICQCQLNLNLLAIPKWISRTPQIRKMVVMIDKTPKKSRVNLAQDALSRSHDLLLALSRAAQSVLLARTAEEIYQAIGRQIKSLGHDVIILTFSDENQYLNYTYSTFSENLIKAGEKLTGLSIQGYRFFVPPESMYGRALKTGRGGFDNWTTDVIAELLPKALRSMAGPLVRLLNIEQSLRTIKYLAR
jgi:hypothetical protein